MLLVDDRIEIIHKRKRETCLVIVSFDFHTINFYNLRNGELRSIVVCQIKYLDGTTMIMNKTFIEPV